MNCIRLPLFIQLVCGLAWLVGSSPTPVRADSAQMLIDDTEALTQRLQLIDSAEHEILLATYEVGDDPVALRILAGLRDAARRGVCVRLIVDGHAENNLMPKPLMEHLIRQGVQIREHQPDVRYKLELGRQRMHDKLLVVDGTRMIAGGRNTRADYYGLAEKNYWDREVALAGATAAHARRYFLARWNASTSGVPSLRREETDGVRQRQEHGNLNDMPAEAAIQCAARLLDAAAADPLPLACPATTLGAPTCGCGVVMDVECIRFLHDLPDGPKHAPEAIAHQLHQAIAAARKCIVIETPYLVFTHRLRHLLAAARRRGVAITLVTNSLETTDHVIVHSQYANQRRWLRNQGIDLWEMKGERHLHAKAMVIDGHLAMLGSYNFDILSETRNSEVAVLIEHCEFAAALSAQIVWHMQMSQKVPEDESLIGFDARTNRVDDSVLREARRKRLVTPWIKKYL
ncbi:MAG: phospholipase D-like domain-containing protein [Aureliella sp.]